MANKPQYESFIQGWNKTVSWAKQNGIPYSAYYPVYQADSQKMITSSSGMGEAERIHAIEAAAGLNYSNALPTDVHSPTAVLPNIKQNASSIFTGLNPFGIIGNVWDTVKNTVEHPSTITAPLFSVAAEQQIPYTQHDIWNLVPGVTDIALLAGGKKGAAQLAENPISSLIDVVPLGRVFNSILAKTARGEAYAAQIGMTTDELSKLGPARTAWRVLKSQPMPKTAQVAFIHDAKGNIVDVRPMSIGNRINAFRNHLNVGKEQGDLMMGAVMVGEEGTKEVYRIAGPAVEALGKLKKEDYIEAMRVAQNDHRPFTEIVHDEAIPQQVRGALELVQNWAKSREQVKLQAGEMVTIKTQFGDENYTVAPGSSGAKVLKAKDDAETAQVELDKYAKPFDALIYKTQLMDNGVAISFTSLATQTAAVFDSIKRSIPELDDPAQLERLRSTLPSGQTWDRAVAQQTPLLKNLLGLGPDERLTLHHVNALKDLFSPGGLLDKIKESYDNADWVGLAKYSKTAMRKFDNKVFEKLPIHGRAVLSSVKELTKDIHSYAVQREKDTNHLWKLYNGTKDGKQKVGKKAVEQSIVGLSQRASKAHQKFLSTALHNPPDVWRNVALDLRVEATMNSEHAVSQVENTLKVLSEQGWEDSQLTKLRQDPRTVLEIMYRSAQNSTENNMLPDIEIGLAKQFTEDAYKELGSLRARGHAPMYVPTLSPHDIREGIQPTYNVFVGDLRPRKVQSTFGRLFEYTPSIYDLQLAVLKDTKQEVERDILHTFQDEYVNKHLDNAADAQALARNYVRAEIAENARLALETGVRHKTEDAIIQEQLARMGKVKYDPQSIFGAIGSTPSVNAEFYIDKGLESALQKTVNSFQLPAQGFWDRGTKIFRYSILGLSPRYTAHILFGGTYLLALRGHVSMVRQLRAGWHLAMKGELPNDVIARYPHADSILGTSATQEGLEDISFHYAGGFQAGNWISQEWLDNHRLAATALNKGKALADINYRFTRAIVRMQRAVTYLDGAARAEKEGYFYENELVPRVDARGNPVLNNVTGKQIHDEQRVRREMTGAEAHKRGMDAVSEVMGELRHMTPLERQWLTKMFPFYGWTKHILTYVLTYPLDHPYRAMFLSQLAEQNSNDVATGLPQRIQLLLFLGQPDEFGNVSTVDVRALDPLRDTANYASAQGFWQSLNPILSAPAAYVDPQIVYGSNSLYPTTSYNALYGIKESGPQGNALTVAEQFVPQLSAADAAFGLSGQYSYLKQTNSAAFSKKIFESLNLPFFPQSINVKQIAAKDEMDRFQQAAADARTAMTTGDFSTISQYPEGATLPDPMNTLYNITPAQLEALYNETMARYGLNPLEALPRPPNPPL